MSKSISDFQNLQGKELLEAAVKAYGDRIVLLSAFNPEDIILSSWIAEVNPNVAIAFLETQKHFPETLNYVERVTKQLGLKNLIVLKPDSKLVQNIDANGALWQAQVNRCCWLRKVEPLERLLKTNKYDAIITGRRSEQTKDRTLVNFVEQDEENRLKFNPLINWIRDQRDQYMSENNLPHHPLYELGYLSIGCAPCTTPVYLGEDERAGRWRHTRLNQTNNDAGKTECGIHIESKE